MDVHEVEPVVLGDEDQLLAIGRIGVDVLELAFQFTVGSNRGENIGFSSIRQPIGSTGFSIKVVNGASAQAIAFEEVPRGILLARVSLSASRSERLSSSEARRSAHERTAPMLDPRLLPAKHLRGHAISPLLAWPKR